MGVTFTGVTNGPLAVCYSERSGVRGVYDEKRFGRGKGETRPFPSKPALFALAFNRIPSDRKRKDKLQAVKHPLFLKIFT